MLRVRLVLICDMDNGGDRGTEFFDFFLNRVGREILESVDEFSETRYGGACFAINARAIMSEHSVTHWLNDLKVGHADAAQKLWERYYDKLVRLAKAKIGAKYRRVADEEDVAASAFRSFFRSVEEGRFPRLDDRDDLWKVLFTVTERKVYAHIKHQRRQKRGSGMVRGDSYWIQPGIADDENGRGDWICPEPTPAFAAEVVEEVEAKLNALPDEKLREIAVLKMDGFTNEEIAGKLNCSTRSVKRKLQVIRTFWGEDEVEE